MRWTHWLKIVLTTVILCDLLAVGLLLSPRPNTAQSGLPSAQFAHNVDEEVASAPTETPTPPRTPTRVIQTAVSSSNAAATPTTVPRPSATPSPTASPSPLPTWTATSVPTPTPWPTLRPGGLAPRLVADPAVPQTATTGIASTDLITIAQVPPPAEPVVFPPGTINIALLGVDTRPLQLTRLSDVIVIASINPQAMSVSTLSIPRDVLVFMPGYRSHKINVAYNRGGAQLFKDTLKYNFGINIDYVVAVNFEGVIRAVDVLGGIEVVSTCSLYNVFPKDPMYVGDPTQMFTVTHRYTDTFTGEVWQVGQRVPTMTINIPGPGVYELDGMQALAFSRARLGVVGGDNDRGHRVLQVLRAMLNKAKQVGALSQAAALYAQYQRFVQTDLSLPNIVYLAQLAPHLDDAAIHSSYFDNIGLTAHTFPEVGFIWTYDRDKLHDFLTQALVPPLNRRANDAIAVEVVNSTGRPNFGRVAAARLGELGFRAISIADSDRRYAETSVVDYSLSGKGSALALMQRGFGLKPQNVVGFPGGSDTARYRIVVGDDFNACYKRRS